MVATVATVAMVTVAVMARATIRITKQDDIDGTSNIVLSCPGLVESLFIFKKILLSSCKC